MEEYTLDYKGAKLNITNFGAYITKWSVSGADILYKGESIKRTGIPLLFPFAGPLTGGILEYSGKAIPQHGFARDTQWQLIKKSIASITLGITEKDINKTMQDAYPYFFETQLHIAITSHTLIYTLRVKNMSARPMPIAPGIHPYFNVEHRDKPFIEIDNIEKFNAKEIDWNNINEHSKFYTFHNHINIHFPNYNIFLEDTTNICNTLVVWSTDDKKDFVCIEPITRPFNAINEEAIWIEPSKDWQLKYIFKVE